MVGWGKQQEEFVPKPGKKNLRGIPESEWGELKSASFGAKLTPTGKNLLTSRFKNVSDLLEKLARGFLKVSPSKPSQLAQAIASELTARRIGVVEFAELSHVSTERLCALLDSQKATESELVWLQAILSDGKYDIEELMRWNNAEDTIGSVRDDRASSSDESLSGVEQAGGDR